MPAEAAVRVVHVHSSTARAMECFWGSRYFPVREQLEIEIKLPAGIGKASAKVGEVGDSSGPKVATRRWQ